MSAADHGHHHSATTNGGAAHQKSFKRKYRKLRYKFKEVMKQSDELFRQEQLSTSALRRMQEENTRLLDLLVDLNEIGRMPKELRHNIGSPSRNTPPRFLSPTILATITNGDPSILQGSDDDVEEMDLDASGGAGASAGMQSAAAEANEDAKSSSSSDDDSNDSDSDSDDGVTKPATRPGQESNYNSDDEDEDKEAYLEEIREWKYARGEPGTPPRRVREQMRADAEQERKDAQEHAKRAAEEQAVAAAAAEAEKEAGPAAQTTNGTTEETNANGSTVNADALRQSMIVDTYRRGHTPDYLKDPRPFLMTLEDEEEWYNEIHNRYDGHIPPSLYPTSPSLKADGDPRNPMSVYCWLRKNQPQVFLQTDEGGDKKPGGRGRGGGRKKAIEPSMDSDDAASTSAKVTLGKRRRTAANGDEAGDSPSTRGGRGGSSRGGSGMRGGRRKADGESPMKKQRR